MWKGWFDTNSKRHVEHGKLRLYRIQADIYSVEQRRDSETHSRDSCRDCETSYWGLELSRLGFRITKGILRTHIYIHSKRGGSQKYF